jgi:hypothetical protein
MQAVSANAANGAIAMASKVAMMASCIIPMVRFIFPVTTVVPLCYLHDAAEALQTGWYPSWRSSFHCQTKMWPFKSQQGDDCLTAPPPIILTKQGQTALFISVKRLGLFQTAFFLFF